MSNKTLKASAKKIKSAPSISKNNGMLVGFVLLTVVVMGLSIYGLFDMSREEKPNSNLSQLTYETRCMAIEADDCAVSLEVADNDAKRIRGLSHRESMTSDRGMLFVSDEVETQCFWMRDMNFSLDMVWLSEDWQVTKIQRDVSPETYPEQFCSTIPDKYMIELTAGSAERLGLETGQRIDIR